MRTTADVPSALGVDGAEARRQLREAERDGLAELHMDESVNVSADFEREYWMLTNDGRALRDKMQAPPL